MWVGSDYTKNQNANKQLDVGAVCGGLSDASAAFWHFSGGNFTRRITSRRRQRLKPDWSNPTKVMDRLMIGKSIGDV